MNTYKHLVLVIFMLVSFFPVCGECALKKTQGNDQRAKETLDAIYKHYGIPDSFLLRETYPYNEKHQVTYLAGDGYSTSNPYSYLWPYSGSLSVAVALYEAKKDTKYLRLLENKVLRGLEEYFDEKRSPAAYASYLNIQPAPDRFYDDNVWIGIDFTDLYMLTKDKKYLDKATTIWEFIESGTDTLLGGGIYWCEQKKGSKNTCSNAPGAVYALKLFKATNDSAFFYKGKEIYDWTRTNLQDNNDYLYFDNIRLDGKIDKTKFTYNSGQMLQASALLYKLTHDEFYLKEAQAIAKSCYNYFFHDVTTKNGEKLYLPKNGDIWFMAVMMRGFIELYYIDKNKEYVNLFLASLDYAWLNMRDKNGLFNKDWTLQTKDKSKWLLTQFGMAEMYAGLGNVAY